MTTTTATTNATTSSSRTDVERGCAAVGNYIATVERLWKTGTAREHTYRPALVHLLETLLPSVTVVNDGAQIECGAPDCTIMRNGLAVGYVEAKDIGAGDLEGKKVNKKQFDRYKAALDTLAVTDYLEFLFYSKGQLVDAVRLAAVDGNRIRPLPANFAPFLARIGDLGGAAPQPIASPTQLAQLMAAKARLLQVATHQFLTGPKAKGSWLLKLLEDFRHALLPDAAPDEFADIYAQTLTYGLFVARLYDDGKMDFTLRRAALLVPASHPFLMALFTHLVTLTVNDIQWFVDDIVHLFAAADVAAIMKDYGKSTGQRDPMIHFYEDFLTAYDAGQRKDRGVWYTPLPVVQFIVRAVDDLLVRRFGLADGLASQDRIPVAVSGENGTARTNQSVVPKVQILDPAAGTGTFLAECVNRIHDRFKKNAGLWRRYVDDILLPRLNGFELLMAPYTMAHIKLDLVLAATGYRPQNGKRLNVFLTNALELPVDGRPNVTQPLLALEMAFEAEAANAVKRDCPVMVVIGNPPYSGESQNKGRAFDAFMGLLQDYKKEPGGRAPLNERNSKWLNDDYVKFLRLAQYYVEKNPDGGRGIVGYINPHGFLDNPTFRGMRWNLLRTFDEIYILNLHGNAKKHETCPDGGKDENVFTIQQGVSINMFVRTGRKPADALGKVFYADLWGKRKDKYRFLESTAFRRVSYTELKPVAPMYFFVPKNTKGERAYRKGFLPTELMPVNGVGICSKRDAIAMQDTQAAIQAVVSDFATLPEAQLKDKYRIRAESRDQKVSYAVADVKQSGLSDDLFKPIAYRPFDRRWTYYTPHSRGFLAYPVHAVMSHLANGRNLGLVIGRQGQTVGPGEWNVVFATDSIVDLNLFYRGGGCTFPLYLYRDMMGEVRKEPNFDKAVFEKIAGGMAYTPRPEELFDYIYAVLHTPEYRAAYREFLKIDFPRIPYPMDAALFKKLAKIGGDLRETHLLKFTPTKKERDGLAAFPVDGDNRVADVRFADGRVYINDTQYFAPVPAAAWDFHIGGYQPAQKWLKDRKGRALSLDDIERYRVIIPALQRTLALMAKLSETAGEWIQ